MNAKSYLMQIAEMEKEIDRKYRRVQALYDLSQQVTQSYSEVYAQRTADPQSRTKVVDEIVDCEREIDELIDRKLELQIEIIDTLAMIPDQVGATILFKRYIEKKRWTTIIAETGLSKTHMYRKCNEAMSALQNLIIETGK